MQGSELFLGLLHERLASSLCPARAFWRCSNPSAISACSARSWHSPSTCAHTIKAGIQRHGGGDSWGGRATSLLALPEQVLLRGQNTLTHTKTAQEGKTMLPSPLWKDGESSAEQVWIWDMSLVCKPCPGRCLKHVAGWMPPPGSSSRQ